MRTNSADVCLPPPRLPCSSVAYRNQPRWLGQRRHRDGGRHAVESLRIADLRAPARRLSEPPDTLLSAYLDLYFWDDDDPGSNPESVRITFDGTFDGQYTITSGSASPGTRLTCDVRTFISPEGELLILLERGTKGQGQWDFWFGGSALTAQWLQGTIGEPPPTFVEPPSLDEPVTVPEPSVLLLVASGLGSLILRHRRRATRQGWYVPAPSVRRRGC